MDVNVTDGFSMPFAPIVIEDATSVSAADVRRRGTSSMEVPRSPQLDKDADELLNPSLGATRHSTDAIDDIPMHHLNLNSLNDGANPGLIGRVRSMFGTAGSSNPAIALGSGSGRQNGLPPKTRSEERKHQREIKRVSEEMKRDKQKQTEEEKKAAKRAAKKEKKIREVLQIWQDDILPNWDRKRESKQVMTLVQRGIPGAVRGKVWEMMIGNSLSITSELFDILGQRVNRAKEDMSLRLGKEETVELVSIDLDRTYPALSIFQNGGPLNEPLRQVLEAYVLYRPDVGYVQGMSYFAALLLLYLESFQAFVALANILAKPFFINFFRMDMSSIGRYMSCFKELLAQNMPDLAAHFSEIGLTPEMYIIDWCLTLFAKSLDLETATRIWDMFFNESMAEFFIFRASLGLLRYFETELLEGDFDFCCHKLTHLRNVEFNGGDDVIAKILSVPLTAAKYDALMKQCVNT